MTVGLFTNYTTQDRQSHEHSRHWERLCIERFGIVPPRTTINPHIPDDKPTSINLHSALIDPLASGAPIHYGERLISNIDPATYNARDIIDGKQTLYSNMPPMSSIERARFEYWTSLTQQEKLHLYQKHNDQKK